MSYGIWKKRGKGWSSIEIDTPGNGETLRSVGWAADWDDNRRYNNYVSRFNRILGHASHSDDLASLIWEANIVEKHPSWHIASFCPGGGEHVQWIAFDCLWTLLSPKGPLQGLLHEYEASPGQFHGWGIENSRNHLRASPIDLPEDEAQLALLIDSFTRNSLAHNDKRREHAEADRRRKDAA